MLKDILPQNEHVLSIFLALCSPVNLLKHNIYPLFGRLKQYFACFDCSIFLCAILLSSGIASPVIQAEAGVTASARVIRSIKKNIRLTSEIMLVSFFLAMN